jgi:ParB/RepB/Spo0J family partition protein
MKEEPSGRFKPATNGSEAPTVLEAAMSLEELMRKAIAAAGCANESEFRGLPRDEQNAFLAEARGLERVPNRDGVQLYDPETIERSPFNRVIGIDEPETIELIDSVKLRGVLQNGIIRPVKPDPAKPLIKWQLIAGERRWLAAKAAKALFPANVRDVGDTEALELQGEENFQRKNLNPMEEARMYQQLRDAYIGEGMGKVEAIERIKTRLHKEKSVIYERLTLLELPEKARDLVSTGRLPASHAALLGGSKKIHDPKTVESLAATIANTPGNAPIPFRESQRLVEEAEKREHRLALWQSQRAAYQAMGRKVLTDAENQRVFRHGVNHVDPHSGFVCGASERNFDFIGYKSWTKAMGKHAPDPVLARAPDGSPEIVYDLKLAEAAVQKNRPRGASVVNELLLQSAERAEAAQKRDRAKVRRAVWNRILDELVVAAERAGENERFLHLVCERVLGRITSSGERTKQVVDRRGLKDVPSNRLKEALEERVQGFNAKELRGMIMESIAWQWAPFDFAQGSWDKSLLTLCGLWGVDVKRIEEQFHPSGNVVAAKPSKRPPVVKKGRSLLTPEAKARIAAVQRARWAKKRK